jgi:tetratricopeptide (TPR) repeat protein
LNRFILELHRMENAIQSSDRAVLSQSRKNALKAGKRALRLSGKFALMKTEALRLMGVYYWVIGKHRKAITWWQKAITEGQRLNDRLELSRTYFEVGKRLLEPKSKYKELDGIKAEEYLEKARVMFQEMDLQWDLNELEKVKLQMAA